MLLTESPQTKHVNLSGWSKLERLVHNFWKQEAVGLVAKQGAFTQDDRYAVQQLIPFLMTVVDMWSDCRFRRMGPIFVPITTRRFLVFYL